MATLDDMAVYFFVRGDLGEESQMVQVSHAILEMAMTYDPAFASYRIVGLDGGQSEKAFNKTRQKINNRAIPHVEYSDPDMPDLGVTAIATIPLTKEQALPLANYRLRRYSPSPAASAGVAFDGQGRANLVPVSLGTNERNSIGLRSSRAEEHSVFNGEVAGSTPAASSIPCE